MNRESESSSQRYPYLEKVTRLLLLRREVGSLSPKDLSRVLRQSVNPYKERGLETFQTQLPQLKAWVLSRVKEDQVPLAIPCASVIMEGFRLFIGRFPLSWEKQGRKNQAALFDFAASGLWALGSIRLAQDYSQGTLEKNLISDISMTGSILRGIVGEEPPVVRDVEYYLTGMEDAQRMAALLEDDPTGFRIIDDFVEGLKSGEKEIPSFYNRELMVAGAEFGGELYKTLYNACLPPSL